MPRALPLFAAQPWKLVGAALAAAAALAACTPRATVPEAERERVHEEVGGQQRYLRVAAAVAPFWADRSRLLLTDQPVSEIDLVNTTGGTPVPPPAAERILPPGTPVRVRDVEFPTGWLIAKRVVMSPRYHPWVYVAVAGDTRPHVIVLSQTASTFEDVREELSRILTADDPGPALRALPPEQQAAIARKEVISGMSARALEMAWGLPEKKRIDRPAGTEEWTWPGGKRRAFLQDERVVRVEKAQ
jgi:hypothetical protein